MSLESGVVPMKKPPFFRFSEMFCSMHSAWPGAHLVRNLTDIGVIWYIEELESRLGVSFHNSS